ncbi:MAG: transporter substrate-binding domain-containing protein [Acutalibacteraceae bacterium]|nr:transporter substrate-binding domain-containing protein [Acutalibacteraceae bacterium]
MKKILALILAVMMIVCCFAGCGGNKVIVAEKESAGETVAKTLESYEYTAVDTQAKALMEVSAGTADAAIVDYVMSIGSIGKGTDYENLVISGDGYSPENYGIAFRKGSDATAKVNEAIATLKANGKLTEIANKYKLADLISATDTFEPFSQSATDSDWAYIQQKGELIIGITYFAPMNYKNDAGELVGFETEFAKAVCKELGIEAKFQEISWNAKETELAAKNIDCIWNGMTITDERAANMSITIPYMANKQVMVVKEK